MKFSAIFAVAPFAFWGAFAAPLLTEHSRLVARVDPALVPEFGLAAGINPTGTGDCDGIIGPNGTPIKIPCNCPPDRQAFIDSLNVNVAAGHDVNNPAVPAPSLQTTASARRLSDSKQVSAHSRTCADPVWAALRRPQPSQRNSKRSLGKKRLTSSPTHSACLSPAFIKLARVFTFIMM